MRDVELSALWQSATGTWHYSRDVRPRIFIITIIRREIEPTSNGALDIITRLNGSNPINIRSSHVAFVAVRVSTDSNQSLSSYNPCRKRVALQTELVSVTTAV